MRFSAYFEFSPLIPLLAGILILLSGMVLRNFFNRRLLLLCLLSAIVVVVLLPLLTGWHWLSQAQRFSFPSNLETFEFVSDALSVGWIPVSSLLVILLLLWPQSPGTDSTTFRREAWCGMWLVAITQWALLTDNIWLQWGGFSLTGWLLCLMLARDSSDAARGRAAGACLVWFTVADFLWLMGLVMLGLVLPTSHLSQMSNPELLSQLTGGGVAVCVTALMLLTCSLILRSGLYPLMSWTRAAAITYRDTAWIIAFGLGPGILLLLRWHKLLTFFPETSSLIAGVGGLSAVLLAWLAWADSKGPARIVHLAAGQCGLVWLGLPASPGLAPKFASFALCLLWLLPIICLGLSHIRGRSIATRWGSSVLFLLAGLLCIGVLGQEQVFESVRNSNSLGGLNPYLLLAGGMFGQVLMSLLLFREIHVKADHLTTSETTTMPVPTLRIPGIIWFLIAGLSVLLCAILLQTRFLPGELDANQLSFPILCGVLMLIGLVAARTWPSNSPQRQMGNADRWEGIRRLAQAEFYIPGIINLGLLLPIRAASQLSRFFEWIIIGQIVQKVPAGLLRLIGSQAAHSDEDADEITRMWHTLTALFVMTAGALAGTLL